LDVPEPRNWGRTLVFLSGVILLLLLVEYLSGLWTNVYAPAQFSAFDSSSSNYPPALNAHIAVGDILALLSVVALILAGLSRKLRLIAPAAVLVISIAVAGELGMAFVNSSPNDAAYSFGMGAMFLVALLAAAGLQMTSVRSRAPVGTAPSTPSSGAQGS
jgi:hypothetical protein